MDRIREAIEGAVAYLTAHPDEARYTDSAATAVVEQGLRVRVDGPTGESVATDMPASVGGTGSAPSAGWLFRASLAACAATLIAMRATQEGVRLSTLRVRVDSESDDQGILGIDPGIPAGPLSVRVAVEATAASGQDVGGMVAWGLEHCPVLDAVRRSVEVRLEG